jgi:ribosome-associated protein
MAVKRAKSSKQSTGRKAPAPASKVTKLSGARKKFASRGPVAAKKKAAAKSVAKTTKPTTKPATKSAAKSTAAAAPKPVPVVNVVEHALDEMKAVNVKVLAVKKLTDITDTMIIASGNSDRHVRSIADRVVEHAKKAGFRPMGVEGERDGEWVLVDLQDVIVHIMLPRVREFYRLESLWDVSAARREAAEQSA